MARIINKGHITKRLFSPPKLYARVMVRHESSARRIRNFSIVAHVDHGKSTLADRLLEATGAVAPGAARAQMLDQLQVERERGITVKAVTASLNYTYKNEQYLLNLIDTPGHVDFSNEVVKSVSACQGVVLLVDANEGVQAQTVAVHRLAKENNLVIIPALNKVDLPRADPEKVKAQLRSVFDIDPATVLSVSAKKGWGVRELLAAIVERVPPPAADAAAALAAPVIDTWHDRHRGVLCAAYVAAGRVRKGQAVRWASDAKPQTVKHLALLRPHEEPVEEAVAGQLVMVGCGPRGGGAVGDRLMCARAAPAAPAPPAAAGGPAPPAPPGGPAPPAPPGGPAPARARHMVFAGVFPAAPAQHGALADAIRKLALNDSAVGVVPDSSPALGQGWRVGFLGLLHLDVFAQRLRQEHGAEAVLTAPSVPYKIRLRGAKMIKQFKGEEAIITNPTHMPDPQHVLEYYEPRVIGAVVTPVEYIGAVTTLCLDRRGAPRPARALDDRTTLLEFEMPLAEVVLDFHDTLKSITSGFASFDYRDDGFHPTALARMDILVNGVAVEELCSVVHASRLERAARRLAARLKDIIPRQMVQVAIQAVVGGKVYARETLKAYRKDVTAKLYGGDVTRKKKLLKQQAEGKKKMRSVANIKIPRDTFIDVLKR